MTSGTDKQAARINTAIVPVAGLGTRFLPATKAMPKEMMTLVDRPLIDYAVDEALDAGITDFVFVTSRGKASLEDHLDAAPELERALEAKGKTSALLAVREAGLACGRFSFVRQQAPLGLGHAVWCARRLVGDGPIAVLLPDDLVRGGKGCLRQMIEAWEETGLVDATMVATMRVPGAGISSYGALEVAEDYGRLVRASGLVEKPAQRDAPSDLAVIGRYILAPSILSHLDGLNSGSGGEVQLTDAIAAAARAGEPVFGYRFEGERFDCGSKSGFLQAQVAFAMDREDLRDELGGFISERFGVGRAAE